MNVDLHSHFFPLDAFLKAEKYSGSAPKIIRDTAGCAVVSPAGRRGNLPQGAYDAGARIKDLDTMRIDLQAISPSPILLYYWDSPDSAAYFSRLQNEAIQEVVEAHPQRFAGLGTVPLQSVREAIAIAEEAKKLGLAGLEIGTSVDGKQLADAEFESFYEAVQGLDLLLFIHPIEGGDQDRRDPFAGILNNVASFPYHTTIAVERMILQGIFERFPNLRVCLAHGGGFLPSNIWRLDHAYLQRSELRSALPKRPSEYLEQMYFDSLVLSTMALQHLVQAVGPERVVIGTDYPMGMGDREPVGKIEALSQMNEEERSCILEKNALRALKRSNRIGSTSGV